MSPTNATRIGGLICCLAATAAPGEIVRCAGPDGRISYQETPCPESTVEKRVGIPTEYPAPNIAERDRIFAREAALDRRLEARRDRELQEAMAREARAAQEAELQARLALLAAQQPQYVVAYPYWRPSSAGVGHRPRPPVARPAITR